MYDNLRKNYSLCWALLCFDVVTTQPTFYSTSYAYHNGVPQTFQVPSGIANGTLFVQLQGAAGGDTAGGLGGFISVSFHVVVNQLITIDIGQMGNINGTRPSSEVPFVIPIFFFSFNLLCYLPPLQ